MIKASVLSLNVGLPRAWQWQGKTVVSAIDKHPVEGRIPLHREDFDGDRQADLTVHGGTEKAVYAYPAEYYPLWRQELPEMTLPYGMFGENLTIEGLNDSSVYIGDRYRIGTAELLVTQPRLPCYKLGMKFGRPTFLKQFLNSRRTGFYFAVMQEGTVGAGDSVELLAREGHGVTVADVVRLYIFERDDSAGLQRVVTATALPGWWREEFQDRLDQMSR